MFNGPKRVRPAIRRENQTTEPLCKNLREKHGVSCRVVVTLRNQRAIIRAMYQELYRLGNLICDENSFYQKISRDQNYCFGKTFQYSQIIGLLMQKFPDDHLVLFYEEMHSSYDIFIKRLVNFLALQKAIIPKSKNSMPLRRSALRNK